MIYWETRSWEGGLPPLFFPICRICCQPYCGGKPPSQPANLRNLNDQVPEVVDISPGAWRNQSC